MDSRTLYIALAVIILLLLVVVYQNRSKNN